MLKTQLKDDGEFLIFTGERLEMYIPKDYLSNGLAEDYGEHFRFFGVCNIRTFTGEKANEIETLNLPTFINVYPSETEELKLTLVENIEDKYYILRFFKGDQVMRNVTQMDSNNLELFVNLVTKGKVPKTVPYNKVIHIWHKNMEINGTHLAVSSTILEIILSEIYRDASNPSLKYGYTLGKKPTDKQFSYITANTREICARNSTFAALTFEDIDSMITSSLNINKYNKKEAISPIEKIIKM